MLSTFQNPSIQNDQPDADVNHEPTAQLFNEFYSDDEMEQSEALPSKSYNTRGSKAKGKAKKTRKPKKTDDLSD